MRGLAIFFPQKIYCVHFTSQISLRLKVSLIYFRRRKEIKITFICPIKHTEKPQLIASLFSQGHFTAIHLSEQCMSIPIMHRLKSYIRGSACQTAVKRRY